jgi:predicted dehydrogenase
VNILSAHPHRQAVPDGSTGNARSATNSPRSVILVGAGRRGLSAHLPALDASCHLRLTAIIDINERIEQLKQIPALTVPMYDSLDPVLAGRRPDLAIVATPHDSHVPLARELLRSGIPTLLEKPPARSAAELGTLLRLSEDLQTPLATSLPLHYRDSYQGFIRQLCSPELTDVEVSIRASVPSWHGRDSWRLSRERAGGGVLIDLGYHYLELLVACLGEPDIKSALLTSAFDTRCEVEGEALVSLWFAKRNVRVELWLYSGHEAAKGSELSISRGGAPLYHSSQGGASDAAPGPAQDGGSPPPTPAAAQLEALVMSGFLDGRGDWYRTLCRQHTVLLLLDDLYAGAEHVASLPETAGQPDMTCPADLSGLPERTPA